MDRQHRLHVRRERGRELACAEVACVFVGLDEDRARAWATLRLVLNAYWAVRDGEPEPSYVTRMLTVAKAIQD